MFEKQQSGPIYTMFTWIIVAGCAYVSFLVIRWLVVTREGNITVFSVLGFMVVFRILGELFGFGGPGTPDARAAAARPAPVRAEGILPSRDYGRLEAFSSGPGWHTSGSVVVLGVPDARPDLRHGRGGFEECVTIAGRTSCSRSSW